MQQIFLRNHLSTCVSDAIQHGMGDEIIDELMGALKYNKSLTDGRAAWGADDTTLTEMTGVTAAAGERGCCGPRAELAAARGEG